jgi:hypothetical protein
VQAEWGASLIPSNSVRLGKHITVQLFEQPLRPAAIEHNRPVGSASRGSG